MRRSRHKAAIEEFIANLEVGDPILAQERYTALFDMSPSTTLNVTYHLWGDGEKRARLLTRLQQEYARAGLEKKSSELPDFLPLILEFMASAPGATRSAAIKKSLAGIETLVKRLKPLAANYSGLLESLADMIVELPKEHTAARVT